MVVATLSWPWMLVATLSLPWMLVATLSWPFAMAGSPRWAVSSIVLVATGPKGEGFVVSCETGIILSFSSADRLDVFAGTVVTAEFNSCFVVKKPKNCLGFEQLSWCMWCMMGCRVSTVPAWYAGVSGPAWHAGASGPAWYAGASGPAWYAGVSVTPAWVGTVSQPSTLSVSMV